MTAAFITAPSMTEIFTALNDANVPYVVVQGFLSLPNLQPDRIAMLIGCTAERAARIMGAVRHPDKPKSCLWVVPGIHTEFYLMEKNGSFFPETFESNILARRQKENGVYRPVFHDVMYIRLYWKLHREGGWKNDPEFQNAVKMMLENLVGSVVPTPDFWDVGLKNGQLVPE